MKKECLCLMSLVSVALGCAAQGAPAYKKTVVLDDAAGAAEKPYLAFPALIDLGEDVLVSYKRGRSHAGDTNAVLDMVRVDGETGTVKEQKTIARIGGKIMQMGEWVRFANGDLANYIDAQQKGGPQRIGLVGVRSADGGKTFGPVERVGEVDGVEYGYAFEAVTEGKTTWMLVMTFAYLKGGVYEAARPGDKKFPNHAGSVDVIRSDDNGKSWRFVRSITRELGGVPINESSFARCGDGFLVAARGYDSRQWLMRTDGEFRLVHNMNITGGENTSITSHVGRPRVFARDGNWYLLGRNFIAPKTPMRLSLIRFDPTTLKVTRQVVLDNDEGKKVSDGYYAMSYWRERAGKTLFNVVTYKRAEGPAQIIRLEFDWQEVR